jgi:hypothetical protein
MPKSQTKMILTAFIALAIAFSGCSHTMNSGNTTKELASQPQPAANDKYSREISELKQVISKNSKSAEAKNAHLKLAQLYSDHKNHLRNYQKSLKHLKF